MYHIRITQHNDIAQLIEIERSAAQLFLTTSHLQWVATSHTLSATAHADFIQQGYSFVVIDHNIHDTFIIAFVHAKSYDNYLHIYEMDVIQSYQRQGIATMLLHHLYHFAQQKNVLAISLTTFRDIAWNAQFYHRFGFEYLPPAQQPPYLQNIVLDEYQQGFTAKQRCVMQLTLNSETATPSYSF